MGLDIDLAEDLSDLDSDYEPKEQDIEMQTANEDEEEVVL